MRHASAAINVICVCGEHHSLKEMRGKIDEILSATAIPIGSRPKILRNLPTREGPTVILFPENPITQTQEPRAVEAHNQLMREQLAQHPNTAVVASIQQHQRKSSVKTPFYHLVVATSDRVTSAARTAFTLADQDTLVPLNNPRLFEKPGLVGLYDARAYKLWERRDEQATNKRMRAEQLYKRDELQREGGRYFPERNLGGMIIQARACGDLSRHKLDPNRITVVPANEFISTHEQEAGFAKRNTRNQTVIMNDGKNGVRIYHDAKFFPVFELERTQPTYCEDLKTSLEKAGVSLFIVR